MAQKTRDDTTYLNASAANRMRLERAIAQVQDTETAALLKLIEASERSGATLSLDETFDDANQVLVRVRPWFASDADALRWYLHERLPSFDHLTPVQIVKQYGGQGIQQLLEYVKAKELGGFE